MALESVTITIAPTDAFSRGIVSHKIGMWSRSGIPYLIAHTTQGFTIKGEMVDPVEGDSYRLWGEWIEEKNQAYGTTFRFRRYESMIPPGVPGITRWLERHIDGIGKVRAKALAEHFGEDVLAILREAPSRALECPGIPESIIEILEAYFETRPFVDPAAYAKLFDMFQGHKFPEKVIERLLDDFGSNAIEIVRANPYLLLNYPRMGWQGVDAWAIGYIRYPHEGVERSMAAILEVLTRAAAGEGHTWVGKADIAVESYKLLKRQPNPDALEQLLISHQVTRDTTDEGREAYALTYIYRAEREVAENLVRLYSTGNELPGLFKDIDNELEQSQLDAANFIYEQPLCIITGPPGTGKSYATVKVIKSALKNGVYGIKVMAPTGKAAKRQAELLEEHIPGCQITPTTIHKALMTAPSADEIGVPTSSAKTGRGRSEYAFRHNEGEPLDATFVIVDEVSMCDCVLMAKLLKAIGDGTKVLFTGDPNQLPSVFAGAVLRDMLAAGVPAVKLTEPRRNSGRIVRGCHDVLYGRTPRPASAFDLALGENWVHIEESNPDAMAEIIAGLHENKKRDPVRDMQVITAENHKKAIACSNLNQMLSRKLNPSELCSDDEEKGNARFRIGDKVIRTENGKCSLMVKIFEEDDELFEDDPKWEWRDNLYALQEHGIVNGDMGICLDITESRGNAYVVVQLWYPDRLVRVPFGDCNLEPAYAITCHRGQGSGFPYVIVPVHEIFYQGLFVREWLYTAMSRAEEVLVTVGRMSAIKAAIGRKTVGNRRTRLREFTQAAKTAWEEENGEKLW